MRALRKGGRDLIVVAVIVTFLAALALSGAARSAPDRQASREGFSSRRFAFSGSLPSGWSRSPKRLVPLLMPREVLSVGTAPMPVGGGGNCGREPVAAIARMRAGDALVSIQEYAVAPRMRPLARTFPLLSTYSSAARLGLRPYPGTRLELRPGGPPRPARRILRTVDTGRRPCRSAIRAAPSMPSSTSRARRHPGACARSSRSSADWNFGTSRWSEPSGQGFRQSAGEGEEGRRGEALRVEPESRRRRLASARRARGRGARRSGGRGRVRGLRRSLAVAGGDGGGRAGRGSR